MYWLFNWNTKKEPEHLIQNQCVGEDTIMVNDFNPLMREIQSFNRTQLKRKKEVEPEKTSGDAILDELKKRLQRRRISIGTEE